MTLPAYIAELQQALADTPLASWSHALEAVLAAKYARGHGDLQRWQAGLDVLPDLVVEHVELRDRLRLDGSLSPDQHQALRDALLQLRPWRKGPFQLFDLHLDTEWRSDWKWDRVSAHLDLQGKRVLDVGSGNGYYQWRMLGAGASAVIGVDPNWLFHCQFQALRHYLPDLPTWHLPLTLEELPALQGGFDTVFSMGVLYHRRSPIDHLLDLKNCLDSGGELVLETLVVAGDATTVLVPEDRYAQMRNVWFLPSTDALQLWLRRAGYRDIQLVDLTPTTVDEQRSTEWMGFQSLPDFLHPEDPSLTVEGLPAPLRATLIARKP
ncbi:tRNA 5-methoxyuridine(34)/uridine 5-oxyacetic acid(34) synthase CmoB [Pseudomonas rhizoryzae]|uniref:tRNA 5-methoxyuridine(34)/uridine 5-oxyacetic acid(34) synthase CmoB n=1 Tax=Pseudomonas rhizoryzae TaxID=2571129 RepID=UPI000737A196|nr:tRNA 5-methoxyuridine(34)/uridine 5-oxyacetic acid(34) synthase CmoB [Pseudomonas rhizoryzae]KTT29224.1 tRNA methyltransferase [Pseudomonas psychrotolerans]KTT30962.1 tRNA methyltransferase [Pseudomonas psychrotolerans]KTT72156.1 tRNA methyltransferase [Pseudomonas psychrotolerans]